MLTDSAFGEHIGLALELPVLVEVFKGAEQIVGAVGVEGSRV